MTTLLAKADPIIFTERRLLFGAPHVSAVVYSVVKVLLKEFFCPLLEELLHILKL